MQFSLRSLRPCYENRARYRHPCKVIPGIKLASIVRFTEHLLPHRGRGKRARYATSAERSAAARAQAASASSSNSSVSFFIIVPPSSSASTMVTARR
jgi:hypothetical protein